MRFVACSLFALALVACKAKPDDPAPPTHPVASVTRPEEPVTNGCRDNAGCAASDFCIRSPGLCGKVETAGKCARRRGPCERGVKVCGCDGRVHEDECAAHENGVDLSAIGGCKGVVPDFIPCGARYCDAHGQYCEIYLSDVPELPTGYRCQPLPGACTPDPKKPPSCACFPPDTPCLSFCGPTWTGGVPGFHLTCQGVREPKRR